MEKKGKIVRENTKWKKSIKKHLLNILMIISYKKNEKTF